MAHTDDVLQQPRKFRYGARDYDVPWNAVVLFDEPEHGEWLAGELGTWVKHAANKFPVCRFCEKVHWQTITVVGIP